MSNLWRYVKLMKVFQTYEGMLHLRKRVKLMVCHAYECMSKYVTIIWDIFLAFQPLWHFRPSELIRKRRPLSWLFVYFSIGFLVINDSDPRQRKRWCVWLQFPFGSRGVFGFWISKYYCSRKSSWARIEWKSNLGGFDI